MKRAAEANLVQLAPLPAAPRISVVAPASFAQTERVHAGVERVRALGFDLHAEEHAGARGPLFFAGTRAQRLSDLHAAFCDAATHMVMAVRGGYGSNYLLNQLDLGLLAAHRKPFFAYSDLTGLQLYLLDRLGLPAFHGPMLAADFYREDGVHMASFEAALRGQPYTVGHDEGLSALREGEAHGVLYGGCLSILVSLIGTPYEPATEGKLLFLEDTRAKPYQVDRMLWQMRQAGKFEGVRGIVFGEMLDCVSPGADPGLLRDVILRALEGLDIPVAWGLRSGHVSRQNVTLTFGVEAELRTGAACTLRVIQPAIRTETVHEKD